MGEQYKQLQFRDRLKIEARLNIGYKPKQIAADLGVHVFGRMFHHFFTCASSRYLV